MRISKDIKDSVVAIAVLILVLIAGYKVGYSYGMNDGVSMVKGDKWDCAWSDYTGFALCNKVEVK